MTPQNGLTGQLITALIIAVVVARVALRASRTRRLKIELMWIRPALFLIIGALILTSAPPALSASSLAASVAALALGCALGWQRGRMVHIEVHPETHDISQRISPAAVIFLIVIVVLRYAARYWAFSGSTGLPLNLITDVLVLFTVGMMVTQSAEMWLRARRLLTEARTTKAAVAA